MNNFFKYLIKNKGKIYYYLFIIIFYTIFNIYSWSNINQADNKTVFYIIILFFDLIALPLALYQPYKEWKDGQR